MGNKSLRAIVLTLCVSILLFLFSGCENMLDSSNKSLNDQELLTTEKVVKLLNDNGGGLTKVNDFPIDLSLCKISGEIPKPYLSKTGTYYLFYEYDGYRETSDLTESIWFMDYVDYPKEFSDNVLQAAGMIGKNLYIGMWYPDLKSFSEGITAINKEKYDAIGEERLFLGKILSEKAFNKKEAILTGKGDSWEVKMPIKYIYNTRENENGLSESIFITKGETYVKYTGSEKELPKVSEIIWSKKEHYGKSGLTGETSLLSKQVENGFYEAALNLPNDFNPETDDSITVKIFWSDGETEEIECMISKTN